MEAYLHILKAAPALMRGKIDVGVRMDTGLQLGLKQAGSNKG